MNLEKLKWTPKKAKVSDLVEFDGQLRDYSIADIESMKQSVERDGIIEPLTVNKNNVIIDGHLRFSALCELGIEEVWVCYPEEELPVEAHTRCHIRMNRNIAGTDDYKMIRQHFTVEELERGGYSQAHIMDIMADPNKDIKVEKPKVYPYVLNFDTDEQKKECEELLSRLGEKHNVEERFEDNLLAFIDKNPVSDGAE